MQPGNAGVVADPADEAVRRSRVHRSAGADMLTLLTEGGRRLCGELMNPLEGDVQDRAGPCSEVCRPVCSRRTSASR